MYSIAPLVFLLSFFSSIVNAQVISNQRAEDVQVLEQNSNLISSCKSIGPLNFRYKPTAISTLIGKGQQDTIDKARERALDMSGDTIVITNMQNETLGAVWRFQGVVMSCFNTRIDLQVQNKSEVKPEINTTCQADIDCEKGFSCRSRKGGGTECRAIRD